MELVIYRNKQTNKIVNFHEITSQCTQEAIGKFNNNTNNPNYATIEELKEDSIAYYFYSLKTISIQQEYDNLRDLENRISDLADDIDCRLSKLENDVKEE